jgi:hypothetical protein
MKEGKQIRPEWIPSAYKEAESEPKRVEIKPTVSKLSPLYSGKKTLLKSRVSKGYKKP